MKRLFTFFTVIILAIFVFFPSIVAGSNDPSEVQKVTVDHIATGFEKARERVGLFLKLTKKDKVLYRKYLVEKRLAELSYAVTNDKIDLVEPTASRYTTYVGRLSEYMLDKDVLDDKDAVVEMFNRHRSIITELQKKFKYDSGWWLSIQHDINVLNIFSQKFGEIN